MAERLMRMGFPIDWCKCALKHSSDLDTALDLLLRWQEEARQAAAPAAPEHEASNSLTPTSPRFLPSLSLSGSSGRSTNRAQMFPVIASSDAVVPQASGSEQEHQQVPLPQHQERDGVKRKSCEDLQRVRKLLFRPTDAQKHSVLDGARPIRVQGPAQSVEVESLESVEPKMDRSVSNTHSKPAGSQPNPLGESICYGQGHIRGRRSGGSLDLDGERVRLRELALQSAAWRMSEAAAMFRDGLQPDKGEAGGHFHCPASPVNEDVYDDQAVDEGWTSIMDIDEPHKAFPSSGVKGNDSGFNSSSGTSTENDNQSVDGPECALGLQTGACLVNLQSHACDDNDMTLIGMSAKQRGRLPSSSWCPNPPKKLQRTCEDSHPHDPGIGTFHMQGTGSGSGRAPNRHQWQPSDNLFSVAEGEQPVTRREGKEHAYQ